ncbi:MAG: redoxin domain-containing protein, partial [Jatrophihabitans sp.]
ADFVGKRRRSRRPYGVVAGLVISFSVSTLLGSLLLRALHLPQDLLRNIGIVVLVIIGLSLILPRLGDLLERPFSRLSRGRAVNPDNNGLVLGLGLGLVFVPCAGPVLATIAVVGASHAIGFGAVILTVAFGIGVGIPLLVLALAGDALVRRVGVLRRRAQGVRLATGVIMVLLAGAIAFNLTDGLQRQVPGYTSALQNHFQNSSALRNLTSRGGATDGPGARVVDNSSGQLDRTPIRGDGGDKCREGAPILVDCGKAPEITGINGWLNTPDDTALSLTQLRGKVVLIDFWTYSCINCQRTLPYLESWYRNYHDRGLEIIGVHTPEFAFEHDKDNVREQAAALGVKYPIAIDNDYNTWNAYSNQYWPAEYLIDASGVIRHVTFGEGGYPDTEKLIRELLKDAGPKHTLPVPTGAAAPITSPEAQTPETYLGYKRPLTVSGTKPVPGKLSSYPRPRSIAQDTFGLSGQWRADPEYLQAGSNAQLQLNFQARRVFLVLGGRGSVTVDLPGQAPRVISVEGVPTLYTLLDASHSMRALMTLRITPGIQAYAFTFG